MNAASRALKRRGQSTACPARSFASLHHGCANLPGRPLAYLPARPPALPARPPVHISAPGAGFFLDKAPMPNGRREERCEATSKVVIGKTKLRMQDVTKE